MATAFLREKKTWQSKNKSSTPKSTPLKGFNTTSITMKVICTKKGVPQLLDGTKTKTAMTQSFS